MRRYLILVVLTVLAASLGFGESVNVAKGTYSNLLDGANGLKWKGWAQASSLLQRDGICYWNGTTLFVSVVRDGGASWIWDGWRTRVKANGKKNTYISLSGDEDYSVEYRLEKRETVIKDWAFRTVWNRRNHKTVSFQKDDQGPFLRGDRTLFYSGEKGTVVFTITDSQSAPARLLYRDPDDEESEFQVFWEADDQGAILTSVEVAKDFSQSSAKRILVRGEDHLGNVSPSLTIQFDVDNSAPVISSGIQIDAAHPEESGFVNVGNSYYLQTDREGNYGPFQVTWSGVTDVDGQGQVVSDPEDLLYRWRLWKIRVRGDSGLSVYSSRKKALGPGEYKAVFNRDTMRTRLETSRYRLELIVEDDKGNSRSYNEYFYYDNLSPDPPSELDFSPSHTLGDKVYVSESTVFQCTPGGDPKERIKFLFPFIYYSFSSGMPPFVMGDFGLGGEHSLFQGQQMTFLPEGEYPLSLFSVDKAGNGSIGTAPVTIVQKNSALPVGAVQVPRETGDPLSWGPSQDPLFWEYQISVFSQEAQVAQWTRREQEGTSLSWEALLSRLSTKVPYGVSLMVADKLGNQSEVHHASFTLPNRAVTLGPGGDTQLTGPYEAGIFTGAQGDYPEISLTSWEDGEGEALAIRVWLNGTEVTSQWNTGAFVLNQRSFLQEGINSYLVKIAEAHPSSSGFQWVTTYTSPEGRFVFDSLPPEGAPVIPEGTNEAYLKLDLGTLDDKGAGLDSLQLWSGASPPEKSLFRPWTGGIGSLSPEEEALFVSGEQKLVIDLSGFIPGGDSLWMGWPVPEEEGPYSLHYRLSDQGGWTSGGRLDYRVDRQAPEIPEVKVSWDLEESSLIFTLKGQVPGALEDIHRVTIEGPGGPYHRGPLTGNEARLQGITLSPQLAGGYDKEISYNLVFTDGVGNSSQIIKKVFSPPRLGSVDRDISGEERRLDPYYLKLELEDPGAGQVTLFYKEAAQEGPFIAVPLGKGGFSFPVKPHSSYLLKLQVTNGDGLYSKTSEVFDLRVPNIPPPSPGGWSLGHSYQDGSRLFAGSRVTLIPPEDLPWNDEEGDPLTYRLIFQNQQGPILSPMTWDKAFEGAPLQEGESFSWGVEISDGYSSRQVMGVPFEYDTKGPEFTIAPVAFPFSNDPTLTIQGIVDNASGVRDLMIQGTNLGGGEDFSLNLEAPTGEEVFDLPQGLYRLKVLCSDKLGNEGERLLNLVGLDYSPPEWREMSPRFDQGLSLSLKAQDPFDPHNPDSIASGVKSLIYWFENPQGGLIGKEMSIPLASHSHIGEAQWVPQGELTFHDRPLPLPEGLPDSSDAVLLKVQLQDHGGNLSQVGRFPLIIDRTPPLAKGTWDDFKPEDPQWDSLDIQYRLVIEDQPPQDWVSLLQDLNYSSLKEGDRYCITARGGNGAGGSCRVDSPPFVYDQSPPELSGKIESSGAQDYAPGEMIQVSLQGQDEHTGMSGFALSLGTREDPFVLTGGKWQEFPGERESGVFRIPMGDTPLPGPFYIQVKGTNGVGLESVITLENPLLIKKENPFYVLSPLFCTPQALPFRWCWEGEEDSLVGFDLSLKSDSGLVLPPVRVSPSLREYLFQEPPLTEGESYTIEVGVIFKEAPKVLSESLPVRVDSTPPRVMGSLQIPSYAGAPFTMEGEVVDEESGISGREMRMFRYLPLHLDLQDYRRLEGLLTKEVKPLFTKGYLPQGEGYQRNPQLSPSEKGALEAFFQQRDFREYLLEGRWEPIREDYPLGKPFVTQWRHQDRLWVEWRFTNGAGLVHKQISTPLGIDLTPPEAFTLEDQGHYINHRQTLTFHWDFQEDQESGIRGYFYKLFHTEEDPDLIPWVALSQWREENFQVDTGIKGEPGRTYRIALKALNGAGLSRTVLSDGIFIDQSAPTIPQVLLSQVYLPKDQPLEVIFSSDDPESGISRYAYNHGGREDLEDQLDLTGGDVPTSWLQVEQNPLSLDHTLWGGPDGGATRFGVLGINGAGLLSQPGFSRRVFKDYLPPEITYLSGQVIPSSSQGDSSPQGLHFSWEGSDQVSGVREYHASLWNLHQGVTLLWEDNLTEGNVEFSFDQPFLTSLKEGLFRLEVVAIDWAGNRSKGPEGRSPVIPLDLITPEIALEPLPLWVGDSLEIKGSGIKQGLSGIAKIQYQLGSFHDPGGYTGGWKESSLFSDSPGDFALDIPFTQEALHGSSVFLQLRAQSGSGQWSPVVIGSAQVDHEPPKELFLDYPEWFGNRRVLENLSCSAQDGDSGLSWVSLEVIPHRASENPPSEKWERAFDPPLATLAPLPEETRFQLESPGLEEGGTYHLVFQVSDQAGNRSRIAGPPFQVDTIAPSLDFTIEVGENQGENLEYPLFNQPRFNLTYKGLEEPAEMVLAVEGPQGEVQKINASLMPLASDQIGRIPLDLGALSPYGFYTARVESLVDQGGNDRHRPQQKFRYNSPPVFSLPPFPQIQVGAAGELAPVGLEENPHDYPLSYHWTFGDESLPESDPNPTPVFYQKGSQNPSVYPVSLVITDRWGQSSEVVTRSLNVVTTSEGPLLAPEVWEGAHTITGRITVPDGIELTLLPGSVLQAENSEGALVVQGRLVATGTPESPVLFTGPDTLWRGLLLLGEGRLSHFRVEKALRGIVSDTPASLEIHKGQLEKNRIGLHFIEGEVTVTQTRFAENNWYAIKEDHQEGPGPRVTDSIFKDNGYLYYRREDELISLEEMNQIPGNWGNKGE